MTKRYVRYVRYVTFIEKRGVRKQDWEIPPCLSAFDIFQFFIVLNLLLQTISMVLSEKLCLSFRKEIHTLSRANMWRKEKNEKVKLKVCCLIHTYFQIFSSSVDNTWPDSVETVKVIKNKR